jgi:hypothetical protein
MARGCRRCGTEITSRYARVRFCSTKCFYTFKRESRPKRKCLMCNIEFEVSQWKVYSKFCSSKCWGVFQNQRKPRNCAFCQKVFIVRPSGASRKYCSKKCASLANRKANNPPRDEQGNWILKCSTCETEFKRPLGTMSRFKRRVFCSKECQRKGFRGTSSPMFRGNRRHYRGNDWPERRLEARKRDGNSCQYLSCDNPLGGKLASVDHIIPFRLHYSNDLENLMCLCRSHHAQKTQAENHLLKGEGLIFRSILNRIGCPQDRLERAFEWWAKKPQLALNLSLPDRAAHNREVHLGSIPNCDVPR